MIKRIAGVVALLAVGGAIWFGVNKRMQATKEANLTQYKVAKVESGTVKKTVSATGILQPWRVVDIKSKAGGRVDKLLVDAGDQVKAGQILAEIDPSDTLMSVDTARADVDSAKARTQQSRKQYGLQVSQSKISVEAAEAGLQAAQSSMRAASSRLVTARTAAATQPALTAAAIASAEAGLVSARRQRDQLDQTQAQDRASARSALDQAQANAKASDAALSRQRNLLSQGFTSKASVDSAEAAAAVSVAQVASASERLRTLAAQQDAERGAADSRVASAQAQLDSAKASSVDIENRRQSQVEAEAAVKQAQAQVAQAQATLNQAVAGRTTNEIRNLDIAQAQASVARAGATMKNAQVTLDQTTVRSPSDGVILKKYVEQGTIISSALSFAATGNNILQLGDITRQYVDVTVDETDIANVEIDQKVEVAVDAYPNIPFEGVVTRIDPQAVVEQNVTTVHVRVEVDNSAVSFRLLKPGMNATCEFVKDRRDDVVMVTNDAIRTDDTGQYLEVTNGTGKPAPPDPKTGSPADPDTLVDVKIQRRPIEVGLEGNETTEITKGAKPGEVIVTQTIEATPQTSGGAFGGGGPGGMRPGRGGR